MEIPNLKHHKILSLTSVNDTCDLLFAGAAPFCITIAWCRGIWVPWGFLNFLVLQKPIQQEAGNNTG